MACWSWLDRRHLVILLWDLWQQQELPLPLLVSCNSFRQMPCHPSLCLVAYINRELRFLDSRKKQFSGWNRKGLFWFDFVRTRDCFSSLTELFPSCSYFGCPERIVNLQDLVSEVVIWMTRGSGGYTSYADLKLRFWLKVYIHFCLFYFFVLNQLIPKVCVSCLSLRSTLLPVLT